MNQNKQNESLFFLSNLDLYTILKDLFHNILLVAMAGATAYWLVGIVLQLLFTPVYTTSTTLMVAGNAKSGASFTTLASDANQFCGILTDDYVLQEVAESLGRNRLDATVTAEVVSDTNLITLTATASSPTMAYKTIEGILDKYTDISEMMLPNFYLTVLVPARYPGSPSNSYNRRDLQQKAVILACVLMTLLIILCSALYDNVKNEADVENKLNTRLYGTIYHEKKKSGKFLVFKNKLPLLVTSPIVSTQFTESYRRMRERLVARMKRSGKKVVLVTSMLENEGKSTVAANLALSLARISDKVCLVDADLKKPAQFKIFSMNSAMSAGLVSYLKGTATKEDILYHSDMQNLYLIAEFKGSSRSSELLDTARMGELLEELRKEMDYIILDTPPMAQVSDAEGIARMADYSLLVLGPDHANAQSINACIEDLENCPATLLGVVLNNLQSVSRWIWQNLHIDISGVFAVEANNASYGHGYGYGYGSHYGSKSSKKNQKGPARDTEDGNRFFQSEVNESDKDRMTTEEDDFE